MNCVTVGFRVYWVFFDKELTINHYIIPPIMENQMEKKRKLETGGIEVVEKELDMSHSLNSLMGGYTGDYRGDYYECCYRGY